MFGTLYGIYICDLLKFREFDWKVNRSWYFCLQFKVVLHVDKWEKGHYSDNDMLSTRISLGCIGIVQLLIWDFPTGILNFYYRSVTVVSFLSFFCFRVCLSLFLLSLFSRCNYYYLVSIWLTILRLVLNPFIRTLHL